MEVGSGSITPMSKVSKDCTSHRRLPFRYAAAVLALGLSLLLAGCGDLSLAQLLDSEEPGELSISPKIALVPASGTVDISGKGGFTPYTYDNKTVKGTLDTATGEYVAPTAGELSGDK
jgi:hypothetical protein